jgi:hypothetical protein
MITDALALAVVDLAVARGDTAALERIAEILDSEDAQAKGTVRHGTPGWAALPPWDPRRTHATRVAADCWADHCSPGQVAIEMAAQIQEAKDELARRVREGSWDVCAADPWNHSPSHAELTQRRAG